MDFDFLSAEHDKHDLGLNGFEPKQEQRLALPDQNLTVGCDFDVTTIS